MVLLWLEKFNWTDFFCKNGIPYTNCQWKSKKQDKKRAKTLQKRCIFHPPRPAGSVWTDFDPVKIRSNRFWPINIHRAKSVRTDFDRVKICSNEFWPGQNLFERILTGSKSVRTDFDPVKICPNWTSWLGGLKKSPLLESFCLFFVLFFAFSPTICIWNGVFAKKIGPIDLL